MSDEEESYYSEEEDEEEGSDEEDEEEEDEDEDDDDEGGDDKKVDADLDLLGELFDYTNRVLFRLNEKLAAQGQLPDFGAAPGGGTWGQISGAPLGDIDAARNPEMVASASRGVLAQPPVDPAAAPPSVDPNGYEKPPQTQPYASPKPNSIANPNPNPSRYTPNPNPNPDPNPNANLPPAKPNPEDVPSLDSLDLGDGAPRNLADFYDGGGPEMVLPAAQASKDAAKQADRQRMIDDAIKALLED
eukprot:CAMPEP_0118863200 /NCGR_PEP_ID=MMETSP1163-20130328/8158_1 /TAXON_ID=124430 /ORGANISM="Phaeomonas parva, Strain CCMP2877" /LENGTH=244 /DNA_ID=CAMNT_0006797183 /DNA_START=114 /DNA_END=848 /DNA_ORIENTATION=-